LEAGEKQSSVSDDALLPLMRLRPVIVVLAAGRRRRSEGLGHPLLQPFLDSTVLGTTVRHAVETQLQVVVVAAAELVPMLSQQLAARDIIALGESTVAKGVGHAIAAGVAERSGAPGWLLLPGHMPLVRPASLLAVAKSLEHHPVVHADHKGRRGYPVAFAAELYSELVMLSADDDASRLLTRYPAHIEDVADPGVVLSIDTAADLAQMRRLAAHSL